MKNAARVCLAVLMMLPPVFVQAQPIPETWSVVLYDREARTLATTLPAGNNSQLHCQLDSDPPPFEVSLTDDGRYLVSIIDFDELQTREEVHVTDLYTGETRVVGTTVAASRRALWRLSIREFQCSHDRSRPVCDQLPAPGWASQFRRHHDGRSRHRNDYPLSEALGDISRSRRLVNCNHHHLDPGRHPIWTTLYAVRTAQRTIQSHVGARYQHALDERSARPVWAASGGNRRTTSQ